MVELQASPASTETFDSYSFNHNNQNPGLKLKSVSGSGIQAVPIYNSRFESRLAPIFYNAHEVLVTMGIKAVHLDNHKPLKLLLSGGWGPQVPGPGSSEPLCSGNFRFRV